jgi:hypothetical protein
VKLGRRKEEGSAAEAAEPSGRPGSDTSTHVPSLTEGISAEELALVEQMEREVAELQAKPSRKLEVGIAIGLVVLSAAGVLASRGLGVRTETGGVDPRWWPTVICALSLVLSVALLIVALTRPPFDRDDLEVSNRGGWYRLTITLVVLALYMVAWTLSGNFVIPSVLLLVVLMWVYDGRGWKALLVYPIATIAFIYLLFHTLLRVPL